MAKILLTGATGYIGSQILPKLLSNGHEVYALVRDKKKAKLPKSVILVEGDLQKPETLHSLPQDLEIAYYFVHAMTTSLSTFKTLEKEQAENFVAAVKKTYIRQIIYLSGLVTSERLSDHLASRLQVETILQKSEIPCTILRAGIIIGSGSASFEIIRDLVEKLPVMVAPKWVDSLCQPISVQDIRFLLLKVIDHPECKHQVFDVGGEEKLTYRDMLMGYAKVRGLHRAILPVPVLTPRLSSYWLYFVTSTNFSLAMALVDSLKQDAICRNRRIFDLFPHTCITYRESVEKCFEIGDTVPKHGCYIDERVVKINGNREKVLNNVWSIGGKKGWYAMRWAWCLRGFIDECLGGVGLRRGRSHPDEILPGDFLDFWRVVVADRDKGHLLLRAEMLVPGEAWLEFFVTEKELVQRATFRPKGILGRLYWILLYPVHVLVFNRMALKIAI